MDIVQRILTFVTGLAGFCLRSLHHRFVEWTKPNTCVGYMGHPFKKSLFDNDYYTFQAPSLKTDVLSSQYKRFHSPSHKE